MHKLLIRQIKKAFGRQTELDSFTENNHKLFKIIDETYAEFDRERKFLNHTIEISSTELNSANQLISQQNSELTDRINKVTRSQAFLNRLFESSQMFIITQNFQSDILTSNHKFTHAISSLNHFVSMLANKKERIKFSKKLADLENQPESVLVHDSEMITKDGSHLIVSWTHSLVENEQGDLVILSMGTDTTYRKEAENKLYWLAHHDSLTEIGNRRAFKEDLKQALKRYQFGALLMIDVNRFKQINDNYGHSIGDKVLMEISSLLSLTVREEDCVFRLSGDEFTVILPNTTLEAAQEIIERIANKLSGRISLEDGRIVHFTVSVGASMFPLHGHTEESLIANADHALYHAKRKGMGKWHIYHTGDESIHQSVLDAPQLNRIRSALKEDRFQLVYQPIHSYSSDSISHYEVLVRMLDKDGSLIYPNDFISAAERVGLIQNIDDWVLDHALQELAKALTKTPNLKFAINISAPSLQSSDFINTLENYLKHYQVPTHNIIVEVTETAYIDNFGIVLQCLENLHKTGVHIALDDFGVGFSSFSYLKKMPLSYVKLDGSYVQELPKNPDDQVFVESLAKMVKAYGMETIAEFVEDKETFEMLKELGVSHAQGYYIGKPNIKRLEN